MKSQLLLIISILFISVTTAQNIGIGTDNPLVKLDLRGKMAMNDNVLLLRGGNDPNHGLTFDAAINGPYLFGYDGGALGTSGSPNALQWDYLGNVNARNDLLIEHNLVIDNAATNNGTLNNGLNFGNGGEGIASNRTTAANQYGLDFYTNNSNRMSITNNGNIGIGNNSPSYPLQFANTDGDKLVLKYNGDPNKVTGIGTLGNSLIISGGDYFDQNNSIRLGYGSSSNGILSVLTVAPYPGKVGILNNTPSATLDVNGTFKLNDGTQGAGKVLTSDENGNASWKSKSFGCSAGGTSTSSIGTGVHDLIFDKEFYDNGNNYDTTTGIFTVPDPGIYNLSATVLTLPAFSTGTVYLRIDVNNIYATSAGIPAHTSPWASLVLSIDLKLNAGDQVIWKIVNQTGATLNVYTSWGDTRMSIHKVY